MDIAAILKYCPEGTKLYSPAYGKVNFIEVTSPLTIKIKLSKLFSDNIKYFFNNGSINIVDGECMLFPSKEQRDWNKFRLPVKRGDIMMNIGGECPFIATGEMDDIAPKYICGINSLGRFQPNLFNRGWTSDFYIPASEEAKKELFDKMNEYQEGAYDLSYTSFGLVALFNRKEDAQAVIDNPNFKKILDTIYK